MQYEEVVILVPPERVRAWVMVLAEALRRDLSVPVACHRFGDAADAPRPLHFESLERRVIGTPSPGHSDWISTADFPQ